MRQPQGRHRQTAGVAGAVKGAYTAILITRIDGQASLIVLLLRCADNPFLLRATQHPLKSGVGDTLQDIRRALPDICGDLWMPRSLGSSCHAIQIGHQVGRDGAPTQHVRGTEGRKNRRVAPALARPIQVSQAGGDAQRRLVATRDDVCAVVSVRLHLVHDHRRHAVAALQAIAHTNRALCRAVAEHGNAEIKGHPTPLPDAQCHPMHRLQVEDVRGMVGRAADDGNARRPLVPKARSARSNRPATVIGSLALPCTLSRYGFVPRSIITDIVDFLAFENLRCGNSTSA
jgi:hypothetical protein